MALLITTCISMTSSDVDICTTEIYSSLKPIPEKMSDRPKTPGDKTSYVRSMWSLSYPLCSTMAKTGCVAPSQKEEKV